MTDKKLAQTLRIGEKLRKIRKSLKLTQSEFGEKIGLQQSYVADLERGRNKPSYDTLTKILKVFHVNPYWLLSGGEYNVELPTIAAEPKSKNATENLISLPILGQVPAGYPITPIEHVDGYFPLPENLIKDPKAFILKVQGASMEPDIYENDLIVVSPLRKTEIKGTGNLAVIRCDSGEVAIKYVHKEKRGIILSSRNPKYPPQLIAGDQTLEIIGKIILKIHFY